MVSRNHHVVCYTHDPDSLVGFLTEVVGLKVLQKFAVPGETLTATMGWPPSDGADSWMLGEGSAGLVEVLSVPETLQDRIAPGLAAVSFAVRDLEAMVEAARKRVEVTEPARFVTDGIQLESSTCKIAGLDVEFVRFGSS
jgi:catechol 2,3-dioxygenase-like lactoylglutathione lyase family enzyme